MKSYKVVPDFIHISTAEGNNLKAQQHRDKVQLEGKRNTQKHHCGDSVQHWLASKCHKHKSSQRLQNARFWDLWMLYKAELQLPS